MSDVVAGIIEDNPSSIKLQIRFGEQLQGKRELSEGLPGKVQITINSHETTAQNSPVDYNCSEYLNLENTGIENKKSNEIKICWPSCKKPFYMVINIVNSKTVEDLVKQVQFETKMYNKTLKTKAKILEILKNAQKVGRKRFGAEFAASFPLKLLCPITQLRIELPAKSLKCEHLPCFDLHTLFSLYKIKPTWECPICMIPIEVNELAVDLYCLEIIKSPSLPANCSEVIVHADGNWIPIMELKKEILKDGQNEAVIKQTGEFQYISVEVDVNKFYDKNMVSKANDEKPNDFKPMTCNQSTDNSDIVDKPSTKTE